MNEDIIKGKWNQIKGDIQARWGRLTDDRMTTINGDRTKLLGEIQECYGLAQDEAEEQLEEFERSRSA